MAKNDNLTYHTAMVAFKKENIEAVIRELVSNEEFKLSSSDPGLPRYDVMTQLKGKELAITNMMLTGSKYVTAFGVIPRRDFEDDKVTRDEAQRKIDYLKELFSKYSK